MCKCSRFKLEEDTINDTIKLEKLSHKIGINWLIISDVKLFSYAM